MPGSSVLHYFSEFAQIQVFWVNDAYNLILCLPLLHLPLVFPSIRVFLCFGPPPPISWFFASASQSVGVSASVLPVRIQGSFPLGLTGLILQSKGFSSLLQQHSSKASILWCSAFFMDKSSHPYMTTGKNIGLTIQTFVGKVISLLFNTLSWFFIDFLPRSNCLLTSWLQSPCTVILEPKKIKPITTSTFFPIYLPWNDETRCDDLSFWMLSFKPAFSLSSFSLSSSSLVLFTFYH